MGGSSSRVIPYYAEVTSWHQSATGRESWLTRGLCHRSDLTAVSVDILFCSLLLLLLLLLLFVVLLLHCCIKPLLISALGLCISLPLWGRAAAAWSQTLAGTKPPHWIIKKLYSSYHLSRHYTNCVKTPEIFSLSYFFSLIFFNYLKHRHWLSCSRRCLRPTLNIYHTGGLDDFRHPCVGKWTQPFSKSEHLWLKIHIYSDFRVRDN